ncbi:OLC1v1000736C1 [Oldenlandia corymbosa var. corymbosa]|uniref:OLC1v1000736C1 n=1 Tax=Oldenlandia corymbosa var. corymbosa TaxID=529605 RepID=A0AAV1D3N6_OLDCO|nr:OLC1v1000736C1 [Oldenlandia corymbosa var. corymbosa]
MACDPSWKTDSGFKSNYMTEVLKRIIDIMPNFTKKVTSHLESKIKWLKSKFHCINDMLRESGCQWNDVEQKIVCEKQWFDSYCQTHKEPKEMWDFKFPYLNQLELVYGRDRATGTVSQGYETAIHKMVTAQNNERGGQNSGETDFSSEEENNNVSSELQGTPNSLNLPEKQVQPSNTGEKVAKRKKATFAPTPLDVGAQLQDINTGFRTFVEGFNSNFATMANAMVEENLREKSAAERMKDVVLELMNIGLPSGDVFKATNLFTTEKDNIDVFFNLPAEMRRLYVITLLVPTPSI